MAGPKGSLRQPKSLKLESVLYRSASVNITRVWLVLRDIECVVSRSIPEFFSIFEKHFKCPGAGTSLNL